MGWDKEKAIKFLQDKAGPPYGGRKCATYVRQAIEAGGLVISQTGSDSAKDYGPRLMIVGFQAMVGDPQPYQSGDVAVIDGFTKDAAKGIKKDHPHGHMAMYDGALWISDFKQVGVKPYPGSDYAKAGPKYVIYRFPH